MEFFYSFSIIILFLLSIFDLVVGLINDAVNFLNSSIGSKVSSRRIIMIFSSVGILLGAILSSGMMEIARKGVFNPSYFYFSDVIVIFLSVMISDIILLNIFNTLGLPTSTTVSMVFCLLGGSFSIAMIKMILNNEPIHNLLLKYIEIDKALNISIGIFLSIIISFVSGSFIHYFIRYSFGFDYEKKLKSIGIIWSAISLSSMTYFLIIKGLHSTIKGNINNGLFSKYYFLFQYFIEWIHENFLIFLIFLFLIWIIISMIFIHLGYNILRFVVLYGTFSLAMAFSGNDLVNFVGIPIAGIQSYKIWIKEGKPPAYEFFMKSLSEKDVQVPSEILIISGIIMILTLWFSKKTKNIASTELNLSKQNKEYESYVYNSSYLSIGIVRFFLFMGNNFFKILPKRFLVKIEKKFKKSKIKNNSAFDLIRASANLTISSILISIATIQKLPLSTTFVTFMVSMGTSLSDRAWDRESAVYRVSGVLNVIRGWLLTGIIAFSMAGIISFFLYFFNIWALFISLFFILFIFYKNYKNYKKIKYEIPKKIKTLSHEFNLKFILEETFNMLEIRIKYMKNAYSNAIIGISEENLVLLKKNKNIFLDIKKNFLKKDFSLIEFIKNIKKNDVFAGIFYFRMYNEIKKIVNSLDIITNRTFLYVMNSYKPLKNIQKKNILLINKMIEQSFKEISKVVFKKKYNYNSSYFILYNNLIKFIEKEIDQQAIGIVKNKYNTKNTFIMLQILLESKEIAKSIKNILFLYKKAFIQDSKKRYNNSSSKITSV